MHTPQHLLGNTVCPVTVAFTASSLAALALFIFLTRRFTKKPNDR